ncbi:hypothetical protein N9335_00760 [Crocinitomicaceae bacterium]|nr:hypothetical protein [Crocinitomicaceae bacterium]
MKVSLYFLLLIPLFNTLAQNEASTCFFGTVGVDFRTAPPQIIYPITMTSYESPSSICDSSGNLLFYTNGGDVPSMPNITGAVWNANHVIMENGLLGDSSGCISSKQGSIIVPFPSDELNINSNLYYLFTMDCIESSVPANNSFNSGLTYAVIDISKNGGLGKVMQKNIQLIPSNINGDLNTGHEPVTAILHGNNTDYWLFSYTNDSLCRMKITSSGISDLTLLSPGSGSISISPKRDYLCAGKDVYQFDSNTGSITFYNTLNTPLGELVFSPDGSKIYNVEYDFLSDYSSVYQYDLSQSDLLNSKTFVSGLSGDYRLWLAPNHKVYLFEFFSTCFDGEISCPNEPGTACDYSMQQTCLGGGTTGIYCSNIMAHLLYDSAGCFVGVEELNENKELIKIIDATGREVKSRPNMLLFYIFNDGTVKKVFLLE